VELFQKVGQVVLLNLFTRIKVIRLILIIFGQLFTSILNSRLNFFANDLNIISENQAGFRKGYSTVDNIFVLHAFIDSYFSFGK
jgi:hypothetical protein